MCYYYLSKSEVLLNNNMKTIFLNNKYTKYYYQIINLAQEKNRKRGKGIARHHIIPAHFYIDNKRKEVDESGLTKGWLSGNADDKSNLVYLTHREHLICHLLLRKMIEVEKKAGVTYAAWRMVNYELEDGTIIKCNSRLYDKIRTEVSETHSITMKGRTPHNKGKTEDRPEVLDNIKNAARERDKILKTCEHCNKTLISRAYKQYHGDKCEKNPIRDLNLVTVKTRGQKRSTQQKENIKKGSLKFYKENPRGSMPQTQKDSISLTMTGKKKPEGMSDKLSATVAKQIVAGTHYTQQPKIQCPHCPVKANKARYNAFHGDKCKHKPHQREVK
jgi:hypothetical protein